MARAAQTAETLRQRHRRGRSSSICGRRTGARRCRSRRRASRRRIGVSSYRDPPGAGRLTARDARARSCAWPTRRCTAPRRPAGTASRSRTLRSERAVRSAPRPPRRPAGRVASGRRAGAAAPPSGIRRASAGRADRGRLPMVLHAESSATARSFSWPRTKPRILGYAYGTLEPRDWNDLLDACGKLNDLYVDGAARRKGAGRALVNAMFAALKARGAPRVVLLSAWRNPEAPRLLRGARLPPHDAGDDGGALDGFRLRRRSLRPIRPLAPRGMRAPFPDHHDLQVSRTELRHVRRGRAADHRPRTNPPDSPPRQGHHHATTG